MSTNALQIRIDALSAQAQQYAVTRDFEKATVCYEQALELSPGNSDLLLQLSYMQSLAGHYRRAREFALAAAVSGSQRHEVIKELLARLRTFNEIPAMLDYVERLLPMSRISIPSLIAIAAQLTYVGRAERAIDFLDEAKRGDPDYPATLLSRAHVLIYLGRFAEAGDDLARVLKRAPQLAQGYWLQSQIRKQTAGDNHVAAITAQLRVPQRTPQDTSLLAFALHKELDDLQRHDEAWKALQKACAAKRASIRYEPDQSARLFDALRAFRPRAHAPQVGPSNSAVPIFVLGMHRSGTTLLEQLLDGHAEVQGLGELYDFTSAMRHETDHHCAGVIDTRIVECAATADLTAVGRRYLQGVAWRLGGKRHFVDKLPSNFLNLGFICEAMPQAKILHMVRDPMETCFSNLRELFSEANPYSYDQIELADYFNQYRRLMAHWHARYPGRILDVDYARLTSEPEAVIGEVCDFIGIAFDPQMLDMRSRSRAVVTASAVQVRDRITVQPTPKWKAYEKGLLPLRQRLGVG